MHELLKKKFIGTNKVLILGYGIEGRSTYRHLKKYFPKLTIGIADQNIQIASDPFITNDSFLTTYLGENYLQAINDYKVIIKSPGINLNKETLKNKTILSQTSLFLEKYRLQTIGITGTKGKSTTASLIHHFLKSSGINALLLGNIGIAAFDKIDEIGKNTVIVFELSAHQLLNVEVSPHVSVLLNIFPEHLDFFDSFEAYRKAKLKIFEYQHDEDIIIDGRNYAGDFFSENLIKEMATTMFCNNTMYETIKNLSPLKGYHNLFNSFIALEAAIMMGAGIKSSVQSLPLFTPLAHRLEFIGNYCGIDFYNDSISTVPQSTIAAVKSLEKVDILLLGGYDRGLDYSVLTNFLATTQIPHLLFMGKAGNTMMRLMKKQLGNRKLIQVKNIEEALYYIKNIQNISTCLLSPAAASYDAFHSFEHRGNTFKALVKEIFG